jgi:hypothetical protein
MTNKIKERFELLKAKLDTSTSIFPIFDVMTQTSQAQQESQLQQQQDQQAHEAEMQQGQQDQQQPEEGQVPEEEQADAPLEDSEQEDAPLDEEQPHQSLDEAHMESIIERLFEKGYSPEEIQSMMTDPNAKLPPGTEDDKDLTPEGAQEALNSWIQKYSTEQPQPPQPQQTQGREK